MTACVLGGMSQAVAQGPPRGGSGACSSQGGGGSDSGGGAGGPQSGEKGGGSLRDLGKAGDRFEAWKIAKLQGAETFSKYEEEEREEYLALLAKIEKASIEDRLSGDTARSLLKKALKMPEVEAAGGGGISAQVNELEASLKAALTDDAKVETLTPGLNKLQWMISETLIYGLESGELSEAKVSSINRKLVALEEKEMKAKKDGKLTDSELERLNEGAAKIWQLIVKGLKGRND